MDINRLPNVGDKITSAKFAFGYYRDETRKALIVDGRTKDRAEIFLSFEESRVAEAAMTGKIPPKEKMVELGAYDFSRASAVFVVESASMEDGRPNLSPEDNYPDGVYEGWRVTARRLKEDESYDPDGETISFHMGGCFRDIIVAEEVQIVGKMRITFC